MTPIQREKLSGTDSVHGGRPHDAPWEEVPSHDGFSCSSGDLLSSVPAKWNQRCKEHPMEIRASRLGPLFRR